MCRTALADLGELCLDSGREILQAGIIPEGIQRLAQSWNWYQRLLALNETDVNALYNAACVHALAGNKDLALVRYLVMDLSVCSRLQYKKEKVCVPAWVCMQLRVHESKSACEAEGGGGNQTVSEFVRLCARLHIIVVV